MDKKLYKFKFTIAGTGDTPASISLAENTFGEAVAKARNVAGIIWPSHEVCLSSVTPNS